jgi:hypothetical protein
MNFIEKCGMIQSLPAWAGCTHMTQFFRELLETMRQRASIRNYH